MNNVEKEDSKTDKIAVILVLSAFVFLILSFIAPLMFVGNSSIVLPMIILDSVGFLFSCVAFYRFKYKR